MAHSGPHSKNVKHGHSANADWVEVDDVAFPGPSPDLPRKKTKWNDLVVQWWDQVRVMPHCALWTPTDWQFALETAIMKDQFWRDVAAGDMKSTAATEIRRREAHLGTTAEARRQLRIRYRPLAAATAEPAVEMGSPGASVTPIDAAAERRARLTRTA